MVSCGCPPTSQRAPRAGQGVFSVALGTWLGAWWMVFWIGPPRSSGLACSRGPGHPFCRLRGAPQSCGSQRPELTPA